MGRTLFDKLWDMHVVDHAGDGMDLLAIDRIFLHDLCGAFSFQMLDDHGYGVMRPQSVIASPDHTLSSRPDRTGEDSAECRSVLPRLRRGCEKYGVKLFDVNDPGQGIVHIIGPEQGFSLPGMTLLCGDSHTCTHGAMGALAFGVGTSEVYHALATSCLLLKRPKTMRLYIAGERGPGVGPMDMILSIIAAQGVSRGAGFAVEYCGPVVEEMPMDERFALCNLTIEMGAEYALIAPDDTTIAYLRERPSAPKGKALEQLAAHCRDIRTDPDAAFDDSIHVDITGLERQITWGINPGQAVSVRGAVPTLPPNAPEKASLDHEKALAYMELQAGDALHGLPIQHVFIGSCSNGRLSHMKAAAAVLAGRHVAPGVSCLVVPGSERVKREAEALGLHKIFLDAGCVWGAPGCSLCCGSNGEVIPPGERCVSTTNRNFIGRQGRGARTHLASPVTAALAAVSGVIE